MNIFRFLPLSTFLLHPTTPTFFRKAIDPSSLFSIHHHRFPFTLILCKWLSRSFFPLSSFTQTILNFFGRSLPSHKRTRKYHTITHLPFSHQSSPIPLHLHPLQMSISLILSTFFFHPNTPQFLRKISSKSQTHPDISHDPSHTRNASRIFVPELSDEGNAFITLSLNPNCRLRLLYALITLAMNPDCRLHILYTLTKLSLNPGSRLRALCNVLIAKNIENACSSRWNSSLVKQHFFCLGHWWQKPERTILSDKSKNLPYSSPHQLYFRILPWGSEIVVGSFLRQRSLVSDKNKNQHPCSSPQQHYLRFLPLCSEIVTRSFLQRSSWRKAFEHPNGMPSTK